jgi:hypothetical protein
MFKFFKRRGCEDMSIILVGDFKDDVEVNYNGELVEFMKDTSELDVLSDHPQGTIRSNSCINMVLGEMWTIYPT